MRIEELWEEMQREGSADGAWLVRAALPRPSCQLFIAFNAATGQRAMVIPVNAGDLPPRNEWPRCRGLEFINLPLDDRQHWGVSVRDEQYLDVFTALAEDVSHRMVATSDRRAAQQELIGRLHRWQRFLSAGVDGLSESRQRGLYGELHFLRSLVIPALGTRAAIASWRAPQAAHQDFQFERGAVEVKTTSAKQPQSVTITSERQLDDTGISALFLHVVVLDVRENSARREDAETLPRIVNDIRSELSRDPQAKDMFDDLLLDARYFQADIWRYETTAYALRKASFYRVRGQFPRIVERNLAAGIGDVSYALSLGACELFSVEPSEVLPAVAGSTSQ